MQDKVIFADHQYETSKYIRKAYWFFIALLVIITGLGVFFVIQNYNSRSSVDFFLMVMIFVLVDLITLFRLLSIKNNRIFIYKREIKLYNFFGKCRVIEYNPYDLVIDINKTKLFNKGIRLTFILSGQKIFSYNLIESSKTKNMSWGLSLKEIKCEITDQHNLLKLNQEFRGN